MSVISTQGQLDGKNGSSARFGMDHALTPQLRNPFLNSKQAQPFYMLAVETLAVVLNGQV
jgi:hypothetical protein